jgi:hypothetical protein
MVLRPSLTRCPTSCGTMRLHGKLKTLNLLELRPLRSVDWEATEDGRVVLLVPKFRHPFLVKWLVPFLAKPNLRVKLDARGSFIWGLCDGSTPVREMVERLEDEFGDAAEPVYDRIGKFLRKLEREECVVIEEVHKQRSVS